MTRPTSGAGPGQSEGRPREGKAATTKNINYDTTTEPRVPHQSDDAWNAGRALGKLLGLSVADWIDEDGDDGFVHVDYHACHLDLGWHERDKVGRELAAAGFVPRWSA